MPTINLKEAIELLEGGYNITLETDTHEYEVCQTDIWINGGMSDGYISGVLGDTVYTDAEDILKKSIEKLENKGEYVTIDF